MGRGVCGWLYLHAVENKKDVIMAQEQVCLTKIYKIKTFKRHTIPVRVNYLLTSLVHLTHSSLMARNFPGN